MAYVDRSASQWHEQWTGKAGLRFDLKLEITTTTVVHGRNEPECLRLMAEHLQELADKFRERTNLPPRVATTATTAGRHASKVVEVGDGTFRVITFDDAPADRPEPESGPDAFNPDA